MNQQEWWPKASEDQFDYKIGECIWWLSTMADQTGLSLEDRISHFLDQRKKFEIVKGHRAKRCPFLFHVKHYYFKKSVTVVKISGSFLPSSI